MCRWEDNIQVDVKKYDWREWIGFPWLRIGTSDNM
jgi:hypothetical protein